MELKYNNELYEVDLEKNDGQYKVTINKEIINIPFHVVNDNCFSVKIDGKSKSIYAAEDDDHFYVSMDGDSLIFDKVKEEEKEFAGAAGAEDRDEIFPPMPGSIVKILVEKGQKVSEGDSLIIVEAMKMESTLYSAIDGVVTEINVEPAQQVDSDDVLIVVEKEEE